MSATVNGEPLDVGAGLTVAALVANRAQSRRGIAVALNGEVVPRSTWSAVQVRDGDRVELLTAAQGG